MKTNFKKQEEDKTMKRFNLKQAQITLLTIEQAKKLPENILACGKWWWLRSPGYLQDYAASVYRGGGVDGFGRNIRSDIIAIRPAFKIANLNSEFGEKVYVGKLLCTVIDKDLVLADEYVCNHRFDSKSNDWETSELKAFIESEVFAYRIEPFTVKVRNVSADICSLFEDLLESFNLTIPSSDRTGAEGEARLFGKPYSDLEDSVTDMLVSLCRQVKEHPDCEINSEEY